MADIKILINISRQLDSVSRNFFWNNNREYDKYQTSPTLISWDRICCLSEGGLETGKTKYVNAAMLANPDRKSWLTLIVFGLE